ncbi:MAG: ATP-binding protein [Actinoplanes sp.]
MLARNHNESARIRALHEYDVLDSPADDELAAVVRVAAMIADVPTATLNLIDESRQCQLTSVGFEGSITDRADSMCAIQFRKGRMVHVPDASRHPLYADNPWVTGRLANVRFYASAPLITPEGYALGTLCAFDDQVKALTPGQIHRLEDLADVIVALFERRREARETARQKKLTETVLETIDVGIVVADATGHLTMMNRSAREWHGSDADSGLDPSELPQRYRLYAADGATPLTGEEVPLMRALRGEQVVGAEMAIRPDGANRMDLSCNGTQLVDDDGTVLGAVVAMTNVTVARIRMRELERTYAALAERGEQLAAAVVELERSNGELEQFAGAVSHDLVRPMAAAHGYLELVLDMYGTAVEEQAAKWIGNAKRAVERMQDLVDALLSYARSGHSPYQPEPVPLPAVLSSVLDDLRTIAEESAARITYSDDLPTVLGDPTLLRQLLQNIIDNAMKYRSPDRECRIAISAERSGDDWLLRVADNGIGIPPDQRDRVFEMFAQVDPAARKGHGIGLSTCLRIMERHGGSVSIEDTPGGGATMQIRLPAPMEKRP